MSPKGPLVTDRSLLKRLNELAPMNSPRLFEQVLELLKKGVEFVPEKREEYAEAGTFDFFWEIISIHRDFYKLNPFGDLFGEYLQEYGNLNSRAGQFFTPTPLTQMMTEVLRPSTEEFQRIQDPASGTGRFMLSTAKYYHDSGKGYNFIFTNIDIDRRMWAFTTLNAILHDIPSINIHGNTISLEYWGVYVVVPSNTGIGRWFEVDPEKMLDRHKRMYQEKREPVGMERYMQQVVSGGDGC